MLGGYASIFEVQPQRSDGRAGKAELFRTVRGRAARTHKYRDSEKAELERSFGFALSPPPSLNLARKSIKVCGVYPQFSVNPLSNEPRRSTDEEK